MEDREVSRAELSLAAREASHDGVPLATKNPPFLPFQTLHPASFEYLVTEIIAFNKSPILHFYGRSGQKQYGLDIYEEKADGTRALYQVKRFQVITPTDVSKAVEEYAGTPSSPKDRRFKAHAFTVVTSAHADDDTAIIDKIHEINDAWMGDLRVDVWGAEALSRRLRDSGTLVYITFGESWTREYCGDKALQKAQQYESRTELVSGAMRAAMSVQYTTDNEIRFRQVDLNGVTVDSLFVDVPVHTGSRHPADTLIRQINPHSQTQAEGGSGNELGEDFTEENRNATAGAAQLLLHPRWNFHAVIIGGPGQGKTTLLQYLCQFYRARALNKDDYSPISAGLRPVTETPRWALRADLTRYAQWRRQRLEISNAANTNETMGHISLEAYLAHQIANDAARAFTSEDFAHLVAAIPLLLAFDSLDEIADTGERDQIVQEIRRTTARVSANGLDAQVIVATRPGNTPHPIWRDAQFVPLTLVGLTPALRMQYLERWSQQSKLSTSEIDELSITFTEGVQLSHVSDLARNPMQLAILLHLMQRRAVLPAKRTTLYEKYIDIFLDRESKEPIVAQNRDLIVSFHRLLAWSIHTRVEQGLSAGSIAIDDLRDLLAAYMRERGRDTASIDQLFNSVTTRVLCLVQRNLDTNTEFQFEVQPLREYFAAEHIYEMSPNSTQVNSHCAALAEMVLRPFWANVMRFMAGKLSIGEIPGMIYALRDLQTHPSLGAHPIIRSSGRALIEDHVLSEQTQAVLIDMLHIVFDGAGVTLMKDGLVDSDVLSDSTITNEIRAKIILAQVDSSCSVDHLSAVGYFATRYELNRVASEQWWTLRPQIDDPRWLQGVIELGALDGETNGRRLADFDATLSQSSPARILRRLIDTATQVVNEATVRACLSEISEGIDDDLDGGALASPYRDLILATSAERFYKRRFAADATQPRDSTSGLPLKTRRTRRRSAARQALREVVDGFNGAFEQVSGNDDVESWIQLYDMTSALWATDCWPVREAIFALPDDVARNLNGAIKEGSSWTSTAKWVQESRQHFDDVAWWATSMQDCSSDLQTMTATVAIMTGASETVIQQLSLDLEKCLDSLGTDQFGATVRAISRSYKYSPFSRQHRLGEPLRLSTFRPSGRLSGTLWYCSNEDTRKRLAKRVLADFTSDWVCSPSLVSVLHACVELTTGKLDLRIFEGMRRGFPAGSISDRTIRQPTYEIATAVLTSPERWPADIVSRCADRLGTRLVQLPAIAVVASRDGWNCGG